MKHINSFSKGQTLISPENQPNQSFINGHNGHLNYNESELSFTNKNGTLKINTSLEFTNIVKEIVGDFAFEDELILFTKDLVSETKGHVWSIKETSENSYSFTKIHEAEYNFEDGTRLQTVGVNENENYKRVYFTDGEQSFRSINVKATNLQNLSIDELNVFPETTLEPPIIQDVNDGGALKPMIVQYCYRLTSFNGNVTNLSMFSDRAVILKSYTDIKNSDTAGIAGDNLGKSVKITIDNIDFSKFQIIEAFALVYEVKDVLTSVKSLGKVNLNTSSVFFNHIGTEPDALISIDEVLSDKNNFQTVKCISTYENLFLAANLGYKPIEDYQIDSIVKQSNSLGQVFNTKYNPNPKEYKFIPGTNVFGGESENYQNGNGIRVSFHTEDEVLSNAAYTDINLPNNDTSYVFKNENLTLTDDYDSFGNKTFNQSIRFSPNKASYQRDEVYRLAIKVSKNNKPSFVKYIGDFKIPGVNDNLAYLNGDNPVYDADNYIISKQNGNDIIGRAIYFKIDVKLPQAIADNYDFFEILRVKRDSLNKTIIDQGVLFPTGDKNPNDPSTNSELYPSGYQYKNGIQLPEKISFINYAGLYLREKHYQLGTIYSFDSPKVANLFQDYDEDVFSKMKILSKLKISKYENKIINSPDEYNAYIPGGGHYFIELGNYHRHVLYRHQQTPKREINVERSYFAGVNQIVPSGRFPSKDVNKLGNFGLANWSGESEREGNFNGSANIDSLYYDDVKKTRSKISSACPTLFLKLNEDYLSEFEKNTFDGSDYSKFPFLNTKGVLETNDTSSGVSSEQYYKIVNGDVIISNLILVNLERELSNQYGGLNDFAISQNQFISIYKQKINQNNNFSFVVGNGDIYIDMFHHQKFSLKDTPDFPSNFTGTLEQSQIEKEFTVTSSISVAIETDLPKIFAKGDKLINSGVNLDSGEVYIFNDAYISQESKIAISKPFNFVDVTEYPNLIQVSDTKLNGSQTDSWSIFREDNFHELDLDKGAITNLIKIKDYLFATQSNEGLSQIFINPRAVIPTEDGRGLTIGSDSPINIEYSKEISKYGTSFFNSIAISDNSFMYINDKFRKIILFKNGVVSISDMTFNQNSFYEKLKGKVINKIAGVYDERYSEMILSLNYGNNEELSISYNNDEKFNSFNGTTDLISNHFINFRDKIFAKKNLKELFIKNEGPKGFYFENFKDFELEFIVNPSLENVKIFDNFIGIINSSGIKFKELRFKTNLVPEQILYPTDNRYKIREGRHLIPYRQKGEIRMRGDYMKVKIIFDNSQNQKISINSVISTVRKSFK